MYNSDEEIKTALSEGEIDAFTDYFDSSHNNYKLIAQFPVSPYLILGEKNATLINKVAAAQWELQMEDKDIQKQLYYKYYTDSADLKLTREEQIIVDNNESFNIGIIQDAKPLTYFEGEEATGVYTDVLNMILQNYNVTYYPIERINGELQIPDDVDFYLEGSSETPENGQASHPFFSYYYRLISKKNLKIEEGHYYKVGVSNNEKNDQIEKLVGNADFYIGPLKDRFDLLLSGDLDMVFANEFIAYYNLTRPDMANCMLINESVSLSSLYLVATPKCNPAKLSLFNKLVDRRYSIDFNSSLFKNSNILVYKPTFADKVKQNLLYIFLAFIVIALFLVFTERTIKMKKQNKEEILKKNKEISIALKNEKIANNTKNEFMSRVSHDMRTPLGAIINISDFGIDEIHDQTAVTYFKQIKKSSDYLLALVNDILQLQRIEQDTVCFNPAPIKIYDLMNSIQIIITPRAREKQIELTCCRNKNSKDDDYYMIDKIRLEQVIINICNNAIKYTSTGGHVDINYELQNNILKVSIKDNGVGMSEEFQLHMYEPFHKEENIMSISEEGTGLGLTITHNIVTCMKGTIEVESKVGKGTTFTVKIPLKPASSEQIEKYLIEQEMRLSNNIDLTGNKILVCEDNKINTLIIKKILEKVHVVVDTAENGKIALQKMNQNCYNLILMDIRMPVMGGLETAKEIRKFNKAIPIIALSANNYPEDIKSSLDAEMNYHLSKPIDSGKLYSILSYYLIKH
ncbi:MAG: response regulator, partial [Bacilli bacterium]